MSIRFFASVTFAVALLGFMSLAAVSAVAAGERELYSFPFNDEWAQGAICNNIEVYQIGELGEVTDSISEHFKEWEKMGLDMSGVMYEVALCAEGFRSSGSANIYKHLLTVGDTVYGAPEEIFQGIGKDEEALGTEEAAETNETMETDNLLVSDATYVEEDEVDSSFINIIFLFCIIFIGVILVGITIVFIKSKPGRR